MFDFSKNYFELFGMPVGFVLDAAELSARYRELQKVVHPDRYAASGGRSQRLSLQEVPPQGPIKRDRGTAKRDFQCSLKHQPRSPSIQGIQLFTLAEEASFPRDDRSLCSLPVHFYKKLRGI